MKDIMRLLRVFRDERDWLQFHTPKNLLLALVGEVGELAELYRWEKEPDRQAVEEEVADCLIMLLNLCNILRIDPESIIMAKILVNDERYPVHLVKGDDAKR